MPSTTDARTDRAARISRDHPTRSRSRVRRAAGLVALPALVAAATLPAIGQRDFSEVEIRTEKIADGVALLFGAGGNIGVSYGADGVVLIDDQYAPLTDKIRTAVANLGTGQVRFVVNTHWHGDHTGGNESFGEAGAVIVAHDNVRARMSTEQFIAAFDATVPPSPAAALPVVTFPGEVRFHLNDEEIHAFHVPSAHTDGDTIVHFARANAIHMGDLYFSGMFPFIDTSSGGHIDGVIAGCDRVLSMADAETRILPGHGPVTGKDGLRAYRDMLQGVRDAVAGMLADGRTRDEIVAADPLAPWDEGWGGGFMKRDRFLGIVLDCLTR